MKISRWFMLPLLFALILFPVESQCKVNFGKEVIVSEGTTVDEAVSFGNDVHVYGTVTDDAVSIGGNVIVESGGKVKGDAVSIGGDVKVKVGGTVKGDTVSLGGDIDVENGAVVSGDRVDTNKIKGSSMMKYIFPHSFTILGSVVAKNIFLGPLVGITHAAGFMIGIIILLLKLSVSFAIAALLTYFFPEGVSRMANYLKEDFPKALLLGIVTIIVIPFLVLFLIVTIIGIPLVPLFLVLLFFVYLFGSVGIALWIGRIIPESEGRSLMVNVLLGVLAIGIFKYIPIIGLIVGLAFYSASFGVVILTRFATMEKG